MTRKVLKNARVPADLDPDVLDVDQDPGGADLGVLCPSMGNRVLIAPLGSVRGRAEKYY